MLSNTPEAEVFVQLVTNLDAIFIISSERSYADLCWAVHTGNCRPAQDGKASAAYRSTAPEATGAEDLATAS